MNQSGLLRPSGVQRGATPSRHDAWNVAPRWSIPVFLRLFRLCELLALVGGAALGLALASRFLGHLKLGSAAFALAAIGLGGFEALRLCRCYSWERLAGDEGFLRSSAVAAVTSGVAAGGCLLLLERKLSGVNHQGFPETVEM